MWRNLTGYIAEFCNEYLEGNIVGAVLDMIGVVHVLNMHELSKNYVESRILENHSIYLFANDANNSYKEYSNIKIYSK